VEIKEGGIEILECGIRKSHLKSYFFDTKFLVFLNFLKIKIFCISSDIKIYSSISFPLASFPRYFSLNKSRNVENNEQRTKSDEKLAHK